MISFTCDYNEGCHPAILERLAATNLEQEPGYGDDRFTAEARAKIRQAVGCDSADVFLLTGGTQTNAIVIDSLLHSYEGAIAADTGHIAVHEAGAIEMCRHKVLTLPGREGKISAEELSGYLSAFHADASAAHMVQPGLVYISYPTEYGTIYSREELEQLHAVCRREHLPLFVDGARLGYGLASDAADIDLPQLARLCDVFYIGGTKVGALCGEAVVFPQGNAPRHFFTSVKQHGGLLAKGRLLGLQFATLFTDGLYERLSRHAIAMAMQLKAILERAGIPFFIDSPTNQQFPILSPSHRRLLDGLVLYETWQQLPDGRCVARFATSWATTQAQIDTLASLLSPRTI